MASRSNTRSLALVAAVLGGSMAVASQSEAAIVAIDLVANGISGLNAGLASNSDTFFRLNPSGLTDSFFVLEYQKTGPGVSRTGIWGSMNTEFAVISTSSVANPAKYSAGTTIDATLPTGVWGASFFEYSCFQEFGQSAADFGPGSFMAFRMQDGSDWYYGYFEVTWDSASGNFEILSGAYESVANTALTIPGASAVPGGAGLAACALLGAAGRRRRR